MVIAFAVPGSLDQPTGGYAYDRRVIAELWRLGCEVEVIDLGEGFPYRSEPSPYAAARLRELPEGTPIIIDGLALGALPHTAVELQQRHPVIALVHHPLALETGLSAAAAASFRDTERSALAAIRHVVVTSRATARLLVADYDVAASAITVAVPGNDRITPNPTRRIGPIKLLAVGAVVPRKGYDVLVEALAHVFDLDWQLVIAGDCTRNRQAAGALATCIVMLRLSARLRLAGVVDDEELRRLYREADIFVLASRHEGYGMAFAEAIAHGLPIVGTRVGAIPETVPDGAGILVPPDDVGALAAALRTMISDRKQRVACVQAARRAAKRLPAWEGTALTILDAIRALA